MLTFKRINRTPFVERFRTSVFLNDVKKDGSFVVKVSSLDDILLSVPSGLGVDIPAVLDAPHIKDNPSLGVSTDYSLHTDEDIDNAVSFVESALDDALNSSAENGNK